MIENLSMLSFYIEIPQKKVGVPPGFAQQGIVSSKTCNW